MATYTLALAVGSYGLNKRKPLITSGDFSSGTLTRNSTATYWDASSELQTAAIDTARTDYDPSDDSLRGLLAEESRTNKCSNYNASPTDTTGLNLAGDPAATLTIVDDSTELTNAGLGGIGNGNAIKLDNSAASSNSRVDIDGSTGNTNPHSVSVFWRGSGNARAEVLGTNLGFVSLPSGYERRLNENTTPVADRKMTIIVEAGSVVYFVLNQMEEAVTASSPIVVAGSSVTREDDNATDTISTWPVPVSYEIVATPSADQDGVLYQADDGTENNRIRFERISGNLHVIVTNGGTEQANLDLGALTDFTEFTVRAAFADNDIAASLDGGAVVTDSSATIPTGLTTRRYGKDTAGEHWNAWIRDIDEHDQRNTDTWLTSGGSAFSPLGFEVTTPMAQGAYTLSGQALGTLITTPIDQGGYTLTGQALSFQFPVSLAQGSYALSGQSLDLSLTVPLAQGSYSLSGQAVTLNYIRFISLEQGDYTLTGQPMDFLDRWLAAAAAGQAWTEQSLSSDTWSRQNGD